MTLFSRRCPRCAAAARTQKNRWRAVPGPRQGSAHQEARRQPLGAAREAGLPWKTAFSGGRPCSAAAASPGAPEKNHWLHGLPRPPTHHAAESSRGASCLWRPAAAAEGRADRRPSWGRREERQRRRNCCQVGACSATCCPLPMPKPHDRRAPPRAPPAPPGRTSTPALRSPICDPLCFPARKSPARAARPSCFPARACAPPGARRGAAAPGLCPPPPPQPAAS
jgi:hypothetical protein